MPQLNDGTGAERHFYHCNTLYSVFANTDETGALAEPVKNYDAYGKVSALIIGSGPDTIWFTADDVLAANPNVSAIGNPWFYTGQRLDPETGLAVTLSMDQDWKIPDGANYFKPIDDDGATFYIDTVNPSPGGQRLLKLLEEFLEEYGSKARDVDRELG